MGWITSIPNSLDQKTELTELDTALLNDKLNQRILYRKENKTNQNSTFNQIPSLRRISPSECRWLVSHGVIHIDSEATVVGGGLIST